MHAHDLSSQEIDDLNMKLNTLLAKDLENAKVNLQHAIDEASQTDYAPRVEIIEFHLEEAAKACDVAWSCVKGSARDAINCARIAIAVAITLDQAQAITKVKRWLKMVADHKLIKMAVGRRGSLLDGKESARFRRNVAKLVGDASAMLDRVSVGLRLSVDPRLRPAVTEACATLTGHVDSIDAMAIDPGNGRLYSGSRAKSIKVWDVAAATLRSGIPCVATLTGHTNSIYSLAVDPDTGRLYSGSRDKSIKVWDVAATIVRSGLPCVATLTGHTNSVFALAIDPDNGELYSGSRDKSIKVWDTTVDSGVPVTLTGHRSVFVLAIDPSNSRLYSGSADNSIKVWDTAATDSGFSCIATLTGHTDSVCALAIDPANNRLYSGTGDDKFKRQVDQSDKSIKVWDTATASNMPCIATITGHTNSVFALAIDPGNGRLFSGSDDRSIKVWDTAAADGSFPCIATLTGHTHWVRALVVDPGNGRLYSGSVDHSIRVWDIPAMVNLTWTDSQGEQSRSQPEGVISR